MSAALRVLSSMLVSVQDAGRRGWQHLGVPVGGAIDLFALTAANHLLGNPPGAAALEITAGGARFEVLQPTLLALTGADLGATLDQQPLPGWTAIYARAGAHLAVPGRSQPWGARAYLALAGGVDVPRVLDARSTDVANRFGGLAGRPLRAGDQIGALPAPVDPLRIAGLRWPAHARPIYRAQPTLRLLPGPHSELFGSAAHERLATQLFQISRDSNRMGYRLEGAPIATEQPASIASLGVLPGAIQVPPSGQPILLMADAQTTGGYPIIGVVIGADLPLAAQLLPGDSLHFALTTPEQARAAWQEQHAWLSAPPPPDPDIELLGWAGALGS